MTTINPGLLGGDVLQERIPGTHRKAKDEVKTKKLNAIIAIHSATSESR
jgi:hypothetical protein